MDETLRQLGQLLLASIPTIFAFLGVYLAYRMILHKPLLRVLQERREKTVGAQERARADIAAAEARTSEYEQRLRESRMAVYKAQEARRQQAMQAREATLKQARERAAAQVAEHRAVLEREVEGAKLVLQQETERLATDIVRSILRPTQVLPTPAGGAQ